LRGRILVAGAGGSSVALHLRALGTLILLRSLRSRGLRGGILANIIPVVAGGGCGGCGTLVLGVLAVGAALVLLGTGSLLSSRVVTRGCGVASSLILVLGIKVGSRSLVALGRV
jgi:predicted phage tail protein